MNYHETVLLTQRPSWYYYKLNFKIEKCAVKGCQIFTMIELLEST